MALDPAVMGANPDVSGESVIVPDSIANVSTRTKTDMGMNPEVGVNLILIVESIVDVSIETRIEMSAKLILVADAVFDLTAIMDDIVYYPNHFETLKFVKP